MFKPGFQNVVKSEELITTFGGYDRNYKIPENSFSDEENIIFVY